MPIDIKTLIQGGLPTGPQGPLGPTGVTGPSGPSGPTGTFSTYSVITSNTQAVNAARYIANTSGGAFTLTLPATPTVGTIVTVTDGGNWLTNNLTIARNGSTIEGFADDLIIDVGNVTMEFIYSGTTWHFTITTGARGPTGASAAASETLTNKTLSNVTISGYTESVTAVGTVSSTHTFNISAGTVQTVTLTASTACTFTMPAAAASKSFTLLLKQPAVTGNGSATFTSVKWGTAGAPTITTAAGKMDMLTFISDGTNWYGSITQGYTY